MRPRLYKYSWLIGALSCAMLSLAAPYSAKGQSKEPASQQAALLSGRVVDVTGAPVNGVSVKLTRTAPSAALRCDTDAAGAFVFRNPGKGPYRLTAERHGAIVATLEVTQQTALPIIVTLHEPTTQANPAGDIAFADSPNFTVAGVTDWTAVGGHGSDATLRTSEDLARTTAALRGAEGATSSDNSRSEEQLQAAVKAAPASYAANLALGEHYLQAAQYERAVQTLRIASAADAHQAAPEYDLALACRGLGDLPQAKLHAENALRITDRAEYHRLIGELDEASGDPFAAVQQMEHAAQLDPSEANYFAWGSELLLHRAILQASQIFARGAEKFPASARLRTGWGTALFAEARYEEAAQRLCEASDLEPRQSEPYIVLGKADSASPTALPSVMERLERYLKLEPQNANANLLVATALMKRDAADPQVEALLQRAISLNPQLAEAFLDLGKIAAAQKQYPQAIDLYRKAITADPQLGEAHFRLAVLYERTGRQAEAKQERELHEAIERRQADAVEQERRSVKQFLVVLQGSGSSSPK